VNALLSRSARPVMLAACSIGASIRTRCYVRAGRPAGAPITVPGGLSAERKARVATTMSPRRAAALGRIRVALAELDDLSDADVLRSCVELFHRVDALASRIEQADGQRQTTHLTLIHGGRDA
jgi:hypothetical protein